MTLAKRTEQKVLKHGHYINGTREILGFHHSFKMPTGYDKWEKNIGSDIDLVHELLSSAVFGDGSFKNDIYDAKFYTLLKEGIDYAAERLKTDGPYSRQAVISFPASHCFESIQVVVRPKKDNHVFHVFVNMRSCNVKYNFANDLFLAYLVSFLVIDRAFGQSWAFERGNMYYNAGSLHKFV